MTDKVEREMVALLQLELMLAPPQIERARKRRKPEMFLKSLIIVATKRATIPPIVLSQKTSCSLGDLHVNDC